MYNKDIRLVDTETGEVIPEGILVHFPRKIRAENWFMAWQEGFERLALENLTGETYRVLMFVFGNLDYENYLRLSQAEIGEALGMKKSNVSRAIKTLIEKQIVLEGPKVGRSKTYRLNSFYGWKGKHRNMPKN